MTDWPSKELADRVELQPTTEAELFDWLLAHESSDWIFRGLANKAWRLETSLERLVSRLPPSHLSARDLEMELLHYFQQGASGFLRNPPPPSHYLAWLFIMRHYDAPTRLLDWTFSPYVALFFAYADHQFTDEADPVVWAIDREHLLQDFKASRTLRPAETSHHRTGGGSTSTAGLRFLPDWTKHQEAFAEQVAAHMVEYPLPVQPKDLDDRMRAQQAAFTLHGDLQAASKPLPTSEFWKTPGICIDKKGEIQKREPGKAPEIHKRLRRIVLKSQWRTTILRALERMNITYGTLFPGLDGIGRATGIHAITGLRTIRPAEDQTIGAGMATENDPGLQPSDASQPDI